MTSPAALEQYQKENIALQEQIEKQTGKTTEQLYEEREKRVRDVIELKVPDRVPISARVNIQEYTGVSNSAAYYDPVAYKTAVRNITIDLEPDTCNAGLPSSGAAKEALDRAMQLKNSRQRGRIRR